MRKSKAETPANAAKSPRDPQVAWSLGGLLVALIALVYWPTWNNGFVSDDTYYVQDTAHKLSGLSGLRDIWLKPGATPQYYPLVHSVLWFEHAFFQVDPRGYHATSVLMHAASVLLFWRLLIRLRVPGAWLAAAIFAVHPVYVETAAWISEQKNTLSCALALGSMLAYLRFAPPCEGPAAEQRSRAGWYGLSLALYVGSLLCKTVTASLPAVLLLVLWWKQGRVARRDVLRMLPFFAVGLPLSCVTVWMERANVGAIGPEWNQSFIERVLIAGRAVWFYVGKLVWPYPLAFTYPRWRIDAGQPRQYAYPTAALAVVAVLWLRRGSIGRAPLVSALIFVGVLTPALGFFDVYPHLFSFVADHYQYHASLALVALAAAGTLLAAKRWGPQAKGWQLVVAAAALFVLGCLAHQKTYAYRDDETLIRDNVALCPDSWAGQYRLGRILINEKKYTEAIEHLREARRTYPQRVAICNNIGHALLSLGRAAEAANEFQQALDGTLDDEDRAAAHFNLGNARAVQRRYADAIDQYRQSLKINPLAAEVLHNYAFALGEQGDAAAALQALRAAVAADPNFATAQFALGTTLASMGLREESLAHLTAAVRVAPQESAFQEKLGGALLDAGQLVQAETHLRASIRLNSQVASARNSLGVLLASRGDLAGAVDEFQQALRIDPRHAGAASNLRKALAAEPQKPGAAP